MQNLDGRFFMAMTISQELLHFPDSLLPLELHWYNLPWEPDWGIVLEFFIAE